MDRYLRTGYSHWLCSSSSPQTQLTAIHHIITLSVSDTELRLNLIESGAYQTLHLLPRLLASRLRGSALDVETDILLTSSRKANLITPGVVPAYVPLILFVPWALICLSLAACYGFVPRLSDKLDDNSLVQLKEELKDRLNTTVD